MQIIAHFDMFRESAAEAVANARLLTAPRESVQALRPLETRALLRRVGMQAHADGLAAAGYTLARHLQQLDADKLVEAHGFTAQDAHALTTLLDEGTAPAGYLLEDVQLMGYARVRHEYMVARPGAGGRATERFARSMTTAHGHGRVSGWQLRDFLQRRPAWQQLAVGHSASAAQAAQAVAVAADVEAAAALLRDNGDGCAAAEQTEGQAPGAAGSQTPAAAPAMPAAAAAAAAAAATTE